MSERFAYGGQAVLNGVMMRGLQQATVAVRAPDGRIELRSRQLNAERRKRWERLPLLRGIQLLGDALLIGVWALNTSAVIASEEDEKPLTTKDLVGTMVLSLGMMIALFFVLPMLIASLTDLIGLGTVAREVAEGVVRLIIFIGYIVLVGRVKEIAEVYGYHGAEHKAVAAYEAGAPLTVESVRRFSTIHPRCGTTLLLVVVALSILVYAPLAGLPFIVRLASRVVLVPLIAALAYELLRLTARNADKPLVRRLMAPALGLQRLTTREPNDGMIEVAIAALVPVLQADGQRVPAFTPAEVRQPVEALA